MYLVGVDTGGTFTDCVISDVQGTIVTGKALSTRGRLEVGVLESIENAAAALAKTADEILAETAVFCHATTAGLNELYTRAGAKVALLTTIGHEDAVTIGRVFSKVAGLGDLQVTDVARLRKPAPLIDPALVFGVKERIDVTSSVVLPLTDDEVDRIVGLVAAANVEAVTISLLWSFLNDEHERRLADEIRTQLPHVFVTASSVIAPVLGEYERTITSVINSYVGPTLREYLGTLNAVIRSRGLSGQALVMQSNGGVIPLADAVDVPVNILHSGPVGGVIASAVLGAAARHSNIITTDVGGTSFDVSVVIGGETAVASEPLLDRFAVATPMIDVRSIGAGGGSIAWVDEEDRALRVGPMSAGSDPGPVCFGRGGTRPTVTDANLVLNRLNPDNYFGGRLYLDREAAERAIGEQIANQLGMTVVEAASGIVDIVDNLMADLVRRMTTERGHDPRDFALYAFGGGGPLHVGAYGATIGARTAVIPANAAVFSALGIASADAKHFARLSAPAVMPIDPATANAIFAELARRGREALEPSGFPLRDQFLIMMRFRNQTHEVAVSVPSVPLTTDDVVALNERFYTVYELRYGSGTALRDTAVEAVTYEVVTVAEIEPPRFEEVVVREIDLDDAVKDVRAVVFAGGVHDTPVFDGSLLQPGHVLAGPALVEAATTTVAVHPGQRLAVDRFGNLELIFPGSEGEVTDELVLSVED